MAHFLAPFIVPFCFLTMIALNVVKVDSVFSDDSPFLSLTEAESKHENEVYAETSPLIVSTMDGFVSAINPTDGNLLWTISTGPGDLLSSSLSNLEAQYNGQSIRLVPSLGGNLFKYNNKKLELLPVSADTLLKSSFKLGDNMIIIGGQEIKSYGVNLHTGALKYACSMNGCETYVDVSSDEDILVIERHTQTVCAINSRNGAENWKFHVGEHRISVSKGYRIELTNSTKTQSVSAQTQRDNSFHTDNASDENGKSSESVRISMMQGYLWSFGDDSTLKWSRKLSSPIADVWQLKGQSVSAVDLFKDEKFDAPDDSNTLQTMLFVGMYNKNLYVKESVQAKKHSTALIPHDAYWIPYAIPDYFTTSDEEASPTAIMVQGADYNCKNGIFFYEKKEDSGYNLSHCFAKPERRLLSFKNAIRTAYDRWKEVVAFSCVLSVLFNFFLYFMYKKVYKKRAISPECSMSTSQGDKSTNNHSSTESSTITEVAEPVKPSVPEYCSRYLADFQQMDCIGHGGFGVVFKAKKAIDDQEYAVKRIKLSCRDGTHEKVMREVKALARLDHPGIVRYFQAWLESPPRGWQEEKDKVWDICDSNVHSLMSESSHDVKHNVVASQHGLGVNPFKPFDDEGFEFVSHDFSFKSSSELNENQLHVQDSTNCLANSMSGNNSNKYFKKLRDYQNEFADDSATSVSEEKTQPVLKRSDSKSCQPIQYLYIQMQLCCKDSLKEWLWDTKERDRCLVLDYFYQIVSAVEYVHNQGLMHRDLKPSNIFFSLDGFIKIGDFGLVTAVTDEQMCDDCDDSCDHSPAVKHTGEVGTTLYMSPEQINRQPYDHRVDIFSLGLIFCELLLPFETQSERLKVLTDIKSKKFPRYFEEGNENDCMFASSLLASNPNDRLSAAKIRSHPLLEEFSIYHVERPRKQRSSRTFSSSSDVPDNENNETDKNKLDHS